MAEFADALSALIVELAKLPGVGRKTASRYAFHLLENKEDQAMALAEAIIRARNEIGLCSKCYNLCDRDPCPICSSVKRDRRKICIVESPSDVAALEKTGRYNGLYHVLHGVVSPKQEGGIEALHLSELIERVSELEAEENCSPEDIEIILATNPNTYGELTANFIAGFLEPLGFLCTRIASGVPVGGYLNYADEMSLIKALSLRQKFNEDS